MPGTQNSSYFVVKFWLTQLGRDGGGTGIGEGRGRWSCVAGRRVMDFAALSPLSRRDETTGALIRGPQGAARR